MTISGLEDEFLLAADKPRLIYVKLRELTRVLDHLGGEVAPVHLRPLLRRHDCDIARSGRDVEDAVRMTNACGCDEVARDADRLLRHFVVVAEAPDEPGDLFGGVVCHRTSIGSMRRVRFPDELHVTGWTRYGSPGMPAFDSRLPASV